MHEITSKQLEVIPPSQQEKCWKCILKNWSRLSSWKGIDNEHSCKQQPDCCQASCWSVHNWRRNLPQRSISVQCRCSHANGWCWDNVVRTRFYCETWSQVREPVVVWCGTAYTNECLFVWWMLKVSFMVKLEGIISFCEAYKLTFRGNLPNKEKILGIVTCRVHRHISQQFHTCMHVEIDHWWDAPRQLAWVHVSKTSIFREAQVHHGSTGRYLALNQEAMVNIS